MIETQITANNAGCMHVFCSWLVFNLEYLTMISSKCHCVIHSHALIDFKDEEPAASCLVVPSSVNLWQYYGLMN